MFHSNRVVKDYSARRQARAAAAAQRAASLQNFVLRPLHQQQAALNLARLAHKEDDISLSQNRLDMLLLTVTVRLLPLPHMPCFRSPTLTHLSQAEADNDVTTALDKAGLPPPDTSERAQLLELQKLIARRLEQPC